MCSHANSTAQSNVKMEKTEEYHIPVLLKQSVDGLNIQPGGVYVDVTFGGGGHSREILSRMDSTAHLYSFDQDCRRPTLYVRTLQLQIPEKLDALLRRKPYRRTAR